MLDFYKRRVGEPTKQQVTFLYSFNPSKTKVPIIVKDGILYKSAAP